MSYEWPHPCPSGPLNFWPLSFVAVTLRGVRPAVEKTSSGSVAAPRFASTLGQATLSEGTSLHIPPVPVGVGVGGGVGEGVGVGVGGSVAVGVGVGGTVEVGVGVGVGEGVDVGVGVGVVPTLYTIVGPVVKALLQAEPTATAISFSPGSSRTKALKVYKSDRFGSRVGMKLSQTLPAFADTQTQLTGSLLVILPAKGRTSEVTVVSPGVGCVKVRTGFSLEGVHVSST